MCASGLPATLFCRSTRTETQVQTRATTMAAASDDSFVGSDIEATPSLDGFVHVSSPQPAIATGRDAEAHQVDAAEQHDVAITTAAVSELSEHHHFDCDVKLLLVGSAGSGRSSLLGHFQGNTPPPYDTGTTQVQLHHFRRVVLSCVDASTLL